MYENPITNKITVVPVHRKQGFAKGHILWNFKASWA
ncbi:MAG: hypothetical protein U5K54_19865 [Cytophagales bacterium]|nr:hypothetical protein [Cytophagales bacterium]